MASATTKDPVCGMDVTSSATTPQSTYAGTTYHFCAAGCKRAFDKEPQKYAAKQS